jgi:hypothetical protein
MRNTYYYYYYYYHHHHHRCCCWSFTPYYSDLVQEPRSNYVPRGFSIFQNLSIFYSEEAGIAQTV